MITKYILNASKISMSIPKRSLNHINIKYLRFFTVELPKKDKEIEEPPFDIQNFSFKSFLNKDLYVPFHYHSIEL